VCNTKSGFYRVSVESGTVTDFHCTISLAIQSEGKCVVADDTDRSEANVNGLTVDVGVAEEEVGVNLITTEQIERFFYLSKCPDVLTAFKRTSSVHLHITSKNVFVEELEGLLVLERVPVFTHVGQDLAIGLAHERFLTSLNFLTIELDEGFDLVNLPVDASFLHHLNRGEVVADLGTKTVRAIAFSFAEVMMM